KVEPAALDMIQKVSDGKVTALPMYINQHILFYNKDIFDKFAVDYPHNHMTWDELYETAKSLTRTDGGVNYLGFSHQFLNGTFLVMNPYGQDLIDPNTGEITFEN